MSKCRQRYFEAFVQGRPAGSEQFVEMIQRLTGRDSGMRKAGRPLKHPREQLVLCPSNFEFLSIFWIYFHVGG